MRYNGSITAPTLFDAVTLTLWCRDSTVVTNGVGFTESAKTKKIRFG